MISAKGIHPNINQPRGLLSSKLIDIRQGEKALPLCFEGFPKAMIHRTHISLWNLFVRAVEVAEHEVSQNSQINILSAGCGQAEEGQVMNAFFGGKKLGEFSARVMFFGIDNFSMSFSSNLSNCFWRPYPTYFDERLR